MDFHRSCKGNQNIKNGFSTNSSGTIGAFTSLQPLPYIPYKTENDSQMLSGKPRTISKQANQYITSFFSTVALRDACYGRLSLWIRNQGTERSSNLSQVAQLGCGRAMGHGTRVGPLAAPLTCVLCAVLEPSEEAQGILGKCCPERGRAWRSPGLRK